MSGKLLQNKDPKLEAMTVSHTVKAPKEIKVDDKKLKRVARPLRHVKHIPVKALVFQSKEGPIDYSYEKKIKTPISKNKLVVQIGYVGLNPVDMKIKNGYSANGLYGEIGLGREYFGVISAVGEKLVGENSWKEGDEVMGIYYHPHLGKGTLQTSLLIDPKVDPIIQKPQNVTMQEAAGSLYCLGAAYTILSKLEANGSLKADSNVLINGGTSSVGMFALQLLKNHFHLVKKIVVITTSTGSTVLRNHFPDFANDLIFINYLNCRGKSSKPLRKMLSDRKYSDFDDESNVESFFNYNQGKFNIVLDFIGGYDILSHSSTLIHSGGQYVTTVGDYVEDYKNDVFESWDNPSANARKMFGSLLWSYTYTHFYFDPNTNVKWIKECTDLLEKRVVKCVIDKVYDWKDYKEAFSYMKTQRAQGKLIMKVEKF